MRTYFDLHGREVVLGRCLGRGGEGAVYAIPHRPGLVAKVYAQRPDDARVRKLGAMIVIGASSPCETLAWPTGLLLDGRGGPAVGFLMPRVNGCRPLHALYGPGTRAEDFPEARWDFLVRAARNLAAAFESVHERGLVVGDVNEGNAVVSKKAVVRLIDCDSFQVVHDGRTYPCPVGVPLFTPPELQGRAFDRVVRTRDHDGFGLAVLLFHLLFLGRHPFAGRHPTREIAVETAIREGLFAFGWEAARQGWEPPPFSLRLADVPAGVSALFERAFSREAARGKPRPTAGEWVAALDDVESRLATCRVDPAHRHARPDGACPFCRIENQGGPYFFLGSPKGADLEAVWRAIAAVRPPGPAIPPPPRDVPGLAGAPPSRAVLWDRRLRYLAAAGVGIIVMVSIAAGAPQGLFVVLWVLAMLRDSGRGESEIEARRRVVEACEGDLARVEGRYATEGSDRPFVRRLGQLEAARHGLARAQETEAREREQLVERIRRARLHRHLCRHRVADAPIPRLGPVALRELEGNGILTAADVEAPVFDRRPELHARAPQVEPELVNALLAWRARVERSFVFDLARGVRPGEFESLERQQKARREAWDQDLRSGLADLVQLRRAILARRQEVLAEVEAVRRRLAQAKADLAAA